MADNISRAASPKGDDALRKVETQIESGVRQLVASIPPERLGDMITELPVLVSQMPQLRYPNLPEAGVLLERLSYELAEFGRVQDDPNAAETVGNRLDKTLGEVVTKLTRPEVKQYIRAVLYGTLVQIDPNSVEALIIAVGVMTLDTMQDVDSPMLKQMVLQTLQEASQQMAEMEEAMANLPNLTEVKPSTRLIIRIGEPQARQLSRTAALVPFLNIDRLALPPEELTNDAARILAMEQKIQADKRTDLNDEERSEQQKMMETTVNLRYSPQRIAAVQSELQRLAQWGAQTDPQRFRDLAELASFAAGSFNLVPPGDHPLLQGLWAMSINAAANQLLQQRELEQVEEQVAAVGAEGSGDEQSAS